MKSKFLVKLGSKLKMIPSKQMDHLSITEAMAIGLACREAQQQQLLKDAIDGDKYYYGHKVVDELELSLDRLEQIYPSINDCIQNLSKKSNCLTH